MSQTVIPRWGCCCSFFQAQLPDALFSRGEPVFTARHHTQPCCSPHTVRPVPSCPGSATGVYRSPLRTTEESQPAGVRAADLGDRCDRGPACVHLRPEKQQPAGPAGGAAAAAAAAAAGGGGVTALCSSSSRRIAFNSRTQPVDRRVPPAGSHRLRATPAPVARGGGEAGKLCQPARSQSGCMCAAPQTGSHRSASFQA